MDRGVFLSNNAYMYAKFVVTLVQQRGNEKGCLQ